jgi:lysozyme
MINKQRVAVASLVASASVLVSIATNEGYSGSSYKDSVGIATIGFGQADGTKMGETTTPVRALIQLENSIDSHAKGMAQCIHVPITQGEYDAYLDFTYNVGVNAFCTSTLNKKLNARDYDGACKELLKWNKADGKVLIGLTKRRQEEFQQCSQNSNQS